MSGWENYEDVCRQLREAGLVLALPLKLAKGEKSERCFVEDDTHEKRGWYRLHELQIEPGVYLLRGSFGVFYGNDSGSRRVELTKLCKACAASVPLRDKKCQACGAATFKPREFSAEQKAAFKARMEEDRKRSAAEAAADAARSAQWATAVWRACTEAAPGGHAYLVKKRVTTTGGARLFPGVDGIMLADAVGEDYKYLARFAGCLVIPLCDADGAVHGLQFIAEKGDPKTGRDKTYWPRGMVAAAHSWTIGGSPRRLALITEGFATALTLHEATGQPVVVAFSANNLLPVARAIAKHTRNRAKLLICGDDDWLQRCLECKSYTPVAAPTCAACGKPHRQSNAGRLRASEVAMVLDQAADFLPEFTAERPADRKGPTDFNDLAALEGLQVVTAQYERRIAELEWQTAATTPTPAPPSLLAAGAAPEGGGENTRRQAVSVMDLDEAVDRYVPIDDGTGDYVFDTWTRKIAKRASMIANLRAGIRGDDVKRHPQWQARGAVYLDQVGFDPAGEDPNILLNTWRGWPLKPRPGACHAILDLLVHLCSEEKQSTDLFRWVLQWMAYPLQNPGAKMHSAVILHGAQGTGKSTIFETLAKIYGDYATVIDQDALEDKFNSDWTDSKLLCLAEEVVSRAEMWHVKNRLKGLVTGEWIRVNPKNIAAYRQRNHLNIVYLSNADQPLPIENDDRRHCVIHAPVALPRESYAAAQAELADGGVEALYHYLLHIDLTGFHPRLPPPMTEAKKSLILLSAQSDTRFLAEWLDDVLDLPVCPCLSTDLYAEYLRWCRSNGEKFPRPSNHFGGAIQNMRGWVKKRARIYTSLTGTDSHVREVIIPPEQALQLAGTACPPDAKEARWLTDTTQQFKLATDAQGNCGPERVKS